MKKSLAEILEELNEKGICTAGNGFGCTCPKCYARISEFIKEELNEEKETN